jgi:uncharacterized membrane protein YidH (DUF202 family)
MDPMHYDADEQTGGPKDDEDAELYRARTELMGQVQVLLAEKRTSLAVMRTGIAVFALPLSVTTVLVGLSEFYNWRENLHFLLPLLVLCIGLVALGTLLAVRSLRNLARLDRVIGRKKAECPELDQLRR